MPSTRSHAALALGLLAAGCYTPSQLKTGRAAYSRGDYPTAVANFDAFEKAADGMEAREAIHEERRKAVVAWVGQQADAFLATERTTGTSWSVFVRLKSLYDHGCYGEVTAQERLLGPLAEVAERVWPGVDKLVSAGRLDEAVQLANALTSMLPFTSPLVQRRAKVRQAAAALQIAEADKAGQLWAARRFHLALARTLDPDSSMNSDAEEARVFAVAKIDWRLPRLDTCAQQEVLEKKFPNGPGRVVQVRLNGQCTDPVVDLPPKTVDFKYDHVDRWTTEEQVGVPMTRQVPTPCQKDVCLAYRGTECSSWARVTGDCTTSETYTGYATQRTPHEKHEDREITRTSEEHRLYTYRLAGELILSWQGGSITIPVHFEESDDGWVFPSVGDQVTQWVGKPGLEHMMDRLTAKIAAALEARRFEILADVIAKERQTLQSAQYTKTPLEIEEAEATLLAAGVAADAPIIEAIATRYRLTSAEAVNLLEGEPIKEGWDSAQRLPADYPMVVVALPALPVVGKDEEYATKIGFENSLLGRELSSLDAGLFVASRPFPTPTLANGLAIRLNGEDNRLLIDIELPWIAGGTSGFGLAWQHTIAGGESGRDWGLLALGVQASSSWNDGPYSDTIISTPITFYLRIVEGLVIESNLVINWLALVDSADFFHHRVSAELQWFPTRHLFAKAGATFWFGDTNSLTWSATIGGKL